MVISEFTVVSIFLCSLKWDPSLKLKRLAIHSACAFLWVGKIGAHMCFLLSGSLVSLSLTEGENPMVLITMQIDGCLLETHRFLTAVLGEGTCVPYEGSGCSYHRGPGSQVTACLPASFGWPPPCMGSRHWGLTLFSSYCVPEYPLLCLLKINLSFPGLFLNKF